MKKIVLIISILAMFGSCELFDAAGDLAEFTVTAIEYTIDMAETPEE